ncbi:MAG: glycosyltransferase family 2 protein [Bacteroidales bacterium]|nr:glycosyltransferase family 2 protein [Bacteroidales bacterium]
MAVKVSIIVPVFEGRDFVVPCVESLLAQTLDDVELVFVDDCGKDGALSVIRGITDAYKGPKIVAFASTGINSGPGAARSVGIGSASGEYVAFVDSDDTVDPDFCESLYAAAKAESADLAYCGIVLENPSKGESELRYNPQVPCGPLSSADRRRFLVSFVSYFTTFLYRRDFLLRSGIGFPHTRSSEDSVFLAECLLSAAAIARVDRPMYHYIQRHGSLTAKPDPSRYAERLRSFDELLSYTRSHGLYEEYKQEVDFLYIKKAFLLACKTYVENESRPDAGVLRQLAAGLEEKFPGHKANSYVSGNIKVRAALCLVERFPRLAVLLLKR